MRHITHEKETEVEFDVDPHGRINLNRDPPGQKSVYIPSGYVLLLFNCNVTFVSKLSPKFNHL